MVYLMVKRLILEPTQLKMIEPKKSNYENTVLVGVVNDSQDEEKFTTEIPRPQGRLSIYRANKLCNGVIKD